MKTPRFNWLYIKIGLYGALLYTIVMAMQYVKSASFSNNVEVLMGSPSQTRHLEWCPNSVQAIYFVKNDATVSKPELIHDLCRIAYSSYKSEEIVGIKWVPMMRSLTDKGEETLIETNETFSFIRQGALIYKVDGLKPRLIAMGLLEN